MSLVLAGDQIYVAGGAIGTSPSGIYAVPTTGGTATLLASAHIQPGISCKVLAVDSESIYFGDVPNTGGQTAQIMKVSRAGGSPVPLSAGGPAAGCIAIDATSVYWSGTGSTGQTGIWKVAKAGGTQTQIVADTAAQLDLVVWGSQLYFVTPTAIKAVDSSGGTATIVAGQLSYAERIVVLDDQFLYAIDRKTEQLIKVSLDGGGVPTVLAEGQHAHGLVLDQGQLYWSDHSSTATDNRLMTLTGSGPTPIAKTVGPGDVVVDATHIYWTSDAEGAIRRTAR